MSDTISAEVISSNILVIGYDEASQVLTIEFASGAAYTYEPVAADAFWRFFDAASLGKHFAQYIRNDPRYTVRRLP